MSLGVLPNKIMAQCYASIEDVPGRIYRCNLWVLRQSLQCEYLLTRASLSIIYYIYIHGKYSRYFFFVVIGILDSLKRPNWQSYV